MKKHADMPYKGYSAGMAVRGNAVYVVGGQGMKTDYSQVVMYNIISNTWHNMQSLKTGRKYNPCVFILGDSIYVAGGQSSYKIEYSMECLNLSTSTATWQSSTDLVNEVSHTSCVTLGGFAVLAGGFSASLHGLASVYKWARHGSWTRLTSMQEAHHRHCAVTDSTRYVYVVGGTANVVERYDTQQDKWQFMANMPTSLLDHACVYVNSTIVVTGRWMTNKIHIYSVISNTWIKTHTTLPQNTKKHLMVLLP